MQFILHFDFVSVKFFFFLDFPTMELNNQSYSNIIITKSTFR